MSVILFLLYICLSVHLVWSSSEFSKKKWNPMDEMKKLKWRDTMYEDENLNDLECSIRLLAYEYALGIQSYRGIQPMTYDALNIDQYCDMNKKDLKNKVGLIREKYEIKKNEKKKKKKKVGEKGENVYKVYVSSTNGNDNNNNGTENFPFKTIYRALEATRSLKSNTINKQIILESNQINYLNSTIILSPQTFDNNLHFIGQTNSTISGGVLLGMERDVSLYFFFFMIDTLFFFFFFFYFTNYFVFLRNIKIELAILCK